MSGSDDKMRVAAARQSLSGQPIRHHLLELGAGRDFLASQERGSRFNDDAVNYVFTIRRESDQVVLFNWTDHGADNYCAQYNDNCNVVHLRLDDGAASDPLAALDQITGQRAESDSVTLSGLVHTLSLIHI